MGKQKSKKADLWKGRDTSDPSLVRGEDAVCVGASLILNRVIERLHVAINKGPQPELGAEVKEMIDDAITANTTDWEINVHLPMKWGA